MDKLPKVLATSVIRASNKGESHGGLYFIDLETDEISQIIDWNKIDIDWEGRGFDRGMRGIAFHKNNIFTALSDEILIYDNTFKLIGNIKNNYLKHCHEIYIDNDKIYMTSTGYDSILEYNILKGLFTKGYCLRFSLAKNCLNKLALKYNIEINILKQLPTLHLFDPNSNDGPMPGDTLHINNVFANKDKIFVSGRRFGVLLKIQNQKVTSFTSIPYHTHNARPYKNGVLANNTRKDKIVFLNGNKAENEIYNIPHYNKGKLLNSHLPDHYARQGFGRGLCCYKDLIIAGSSPATVSIYRRGNPDPIKSVNITMDIRNAIHGLEVFDCGEYFKHTLRKII